MRTRTRLTTPPGEEPAPPPAAEDQDATPEHERYVAGFDLPQEPRPPGRHRRKVLVALALALVVVAGWLVLQVVTAGEDFDPAVGEDPSVPSAPADDTGDVTTGDVTTSDDAQG